MAEKLTDPSKPAHEIIEVLEDGDAIRNDGVRLTAANKNPWYVLATIYGEQEEGATPWDYDEELAAKNRRAWNGWYCGDLSDEDRADRAKKTGLEPEDLAPLSKKELAEIEERFVARMGEGAELPAQNENLEFSKIIFSKPVFFEKMIVENNAYFISATFSDYAYFGSATFSSSADFGSARFSDHADFGSATFSDYAYFGSATFSSSADFGSATFSSSADFRSATFSDNADFRSATFSGSADFSWYEDHEGKKAPYPVRFLRQADFSSAQFKSTTRFTDALFYSAVPQFHATELYDDTVFPARNEDVKNWPPLHGAVLLEGEAEPVAVMDAKEQKRAYNRLRLFMNRSLQIDEEQFFHRMEMRCKKEIADGIHTPIYWFYEKLSDYGNSVVRPVIGIVVVILLGALAKLWLNTEIGIDWKPAMLDIGVFYHSLITSFGKLGEPFGWSISNTLPFLGFGKLYYSGKFAANLPVWLKIIGGVQTLLGYVLLFFFGLGLRNRFRLR